MGNKNNIVVSEIEFYNQGSSALATARIIFMEYFTYLYKESPAKTLGISNVQDHLTKIFEGTIKSFEAQNLKGFLAYFDNVPVGFATYGELEDPTIVLLRTMPITLSHLAISTEIRKAFVANITGTFPQAREVVMMVRKANESYKLFCKEAGFCENKLIFDRSEYIRATYDQNWYHAYVLDFASVKTSPGTVF